MIKALFIAVTAEQARYWANQWGYRPDEIRFVSITDWRRGILGYREPDFPAYVCGSRGPGDDLWRELETRGFEVYYAETLQI